MDELILNSIADKIIEYFKNGMHAGHDILSFAESTLGIATPEELYRLLAEPGMYGDGIVDLIFARNDELSMSIEPLVPLKGLSRKSLDYLIGLIINEQKQALVLFDGTGITAPVELTEPLVRRFIDRLNLSASLPFHHTNAFPDGLHQVFGSAIRVILRNARYKTTPDREDFIISLVNSMALMEPEAGNGILQKCLMYVLELFNENANNDNMYAMLSAKKRSYENTLAASEQFIEYYSRYSMEYLMSRKIQPPVADVDDIRNKMYLTDLICFSVFGKPAAAEPEKGMFFFEKKE